MTVAYMLRASIFLPECSMYNGIYFVFTAFTFQIFSLGVWRKKSF